MARYGWFSIGLFIFGIILLAYSMIIGQGSVYLILFIPVFQSSSVYALFGLLCIMASIFLSFFWLAGRRATPFPVEKKPMIKKAKTEKKYGGVLLLGPIPLIFGSDMKMATIAIILAIILIIMAVLLILLLPLILLP